MIHYSCDRCGRPIDPKAELRYAVKLEVEAVLEPVDGEVVDDDDRDYLIEIHEILEHTDPNDTSPVDDGLFQRRHFDLCPECYRRFIKSPLGPGSKKQLDFSQN